MTPLVKVTDADDQIKQGTNPIGLGQTVAPKLKKKCCFLDVMKEFRDVFDENVHFT